MKLLLPAALAAALLAGCGRAGDEPLFPLESGRRWTYRVTTTYDDGLMDTLEERLEMAAIGASTMAGAPAWKRSSSEGAAYWLRSDDSGV